ncbi:MAG TPA: lysylphosphatidylglycerol synthase transmembrane domain-containing protein [Gemmatimonadales bacterium]|nr:lysylphosphatidylglycerol synthase transmembrane domain-containing protein [Gemmatimonadales bacterium]
MAQRYRRLVLVGIAIAIAGGLVFLTHRAEARAVWHELGRIPPTAVGAALLLVFGQVTCQALRLWAVIPRDRFISMPRAAYAFMLGEWTNMFTPARAGDALKVVLLNRGASISLPQATGAMLADKVVNIGSLILLCAVSGVAGTIWTTAWARGALPLTALLIGALLATALLLVPKSRVRILGRLIVLQHELARGFTALADPKRLVISTAFSFGAWLAELLALQILCAAVGSPQPLQNLVLAVAVLNVGISVPMSPANVGIYEMALAFGLSRAGLPGPAALAVATVHHGIQLLAVNVAAAALTLWASALSSPTT